MTRTLGQTATPCCNDRGHSPTAIPGKRGLELPDDWVDDLLIKLGRSLPCVFYESTLDLVVTAISPNAFELIGIRSDHIVGKSAFWQERLTAPHRARLLARLQQLNSTDFASEIHKITDDRGLPVWVAHNFRKVRSGHDAGICGCIVPLQGGFSATALDNLAISQFVHKIGNHFQLMNFLMGSLQRNGTNSAEVEALQQTVDRAVEFTRAFSHYSQPLAGLSKIEVSELLRSAMRSLAPAFLEKNVAVNDTVEPSLSGTFVDGDFFLLELAFKAVLQNALDATKNGDQIAIGGQAERANFEGKPLVRVAILDTGCGIDKELLDKAVEPFVSSKRDHDGLGLSTAVRIVEMHGGALKISSTAGLGTEVEILLPLSSSAESN